MTPSPARRLVPAFAGLALAAAFARADAPAPTPVAARKPVSFVRDVRPILARHCYACHGPDDAQRKAKLRLDRKADAFAEHAGGRPFVPGSVDESEAIRRVTSADPEERMPPGKGPDKALPADQVAVLRRWVEEGAKWESHWAFEKPGRPDPPAGRGRGTRSTGSSSPASRPRG